MDCTHVLLASMTDSTPDCHSGMSWDASYDNEAEPKQLPPIGVAVSGVVGLRQGLRVKLFDGPYTGKDTRDARD